MPFRKGKCNQGYQYVSPVDSWQNRKFKSLFSVDTDTCCAVLPPKFPTSHFQGGDSRMFTQGI